MSKKDKSTSDTSQAQQSGQDHVLGNEDPTLWQLAALYYGTPLLWSSIVNANPDEKGFTYKSGTKLTIPAPSSDRMTCVRERSSVEPSAFLVFSHCDGTPNSTFIRPVGGDAATALLENLVQDPATLDLSSMTTDYFTLQWRQFDMDTRPNQEDMQTFAVFSINTEQVWQIDSAARQAARDAYTHFARLIEALVNGSTLLTVQTEDYLRRSLAFQLPMAANDALFYHYGINTGLGIQNSPYVDLVPGMRLCFDLTDYQFISYESKDNGLRIAGQAQYDITRDAHGNITFDPFLAQISSPQIGWHPVVGIADLQAEGTARRYYRLFYPTSLPESARTEQSVMIVGAHNLQQLEDATTAYLADGYIDIPVAPDQPLSIMQLLGRITVVPQLPVYLNNSLSYVSLGTTVRQVIDGLAPGWNPASVQSSQALSMQRVMTTTNGVPQYAPVVFDPNSDVANGALYDVPLLAHDRLSIGG